MKISNFKLIKTIGNCPLNWEFKATIDVETGILFWKKIKTKQIQRQFGGFWYFTETGKFTPCTIVERLARAWKAKTGEEC